jgi:uncharacterized protein YjiK
MITRILGLLTILSLSNISCDKDDGPSVDKLTLVSQNELSVPEPSGLTFSSDKKSLYTVSDQSGKVYKLSLTGEILTTLSFVGDDLEGITIDPDNGQIWVVEERSRNVIKLNASGNELYRFQLKIEQNEDNSGLEGITINPNNQHLYILNEKNPGLLVEIDKNGALLRESELNFASDYSGIFYDEKEAILWIISDQSKTVNRCNLTGDLIQSYSIPISKAEGIVVDSNEKRVYIIRDDNAKLYAFEY